MRKNRSADHLQSVLVMPARNAEKSIEKVTRTAIGQTVLPSKCRVLNDGSMKATASIIFLYLAKFEWRGFRRLSPHRDRSFGAKVYAFRSGFGKAKSILTIK